MSELLDKTDHPDLVVTEPVTLSMVDKNNGLNNQNSEDSQSDKHEGSSSSFESSSASSPGSNADANLNHSSSLVDSHETNIDATQSPKSTAFRPYSISVESHETGDTDQLSNGPPQDISGKIRHRLITGVCISLSLAVLSLGTLDLRGMIEQNATIDSKFNITYAQKKEQANLPPNVRFKDSKPSGEGLLPIVKTDWVGNSMGFADETGKVVIPPAYVDVGAFHDGLAAVKVNSKINKIENSGYVNPTNYVQGYGTPDTYLWGYIDKSGKIVIQPRFYEASTFDNGVAPAQLDSKGVLIDKNGRVLATSKSDQIPKKLGELYELFGSKYLVGLVDKTGKWVLPPQFDRIDYFQKRAVVNQIPSTNSATKDNDDQYFEILQNHRWGVIDRTGRIVLAPNYDEVSSFNMGHAAVLINGKFGFVDTNNKIVIEPRYDYVTAYDDVIAVKQGPNWHLLDSTGKQLNVAIDGVISDSSKPWLSDGYGAFIKDGLCGFVNNKGVIAIKPQYDFAFGFSDGYALVWSDGVWKFIDHQGKIASAKTFSVASPFYKNNSNVTIAGPLHGFVNARDIENIKSAFGSRRKLFINGQSGEFD